MIDDSKEKIVDRVKKLLSAHDGCKRINSENEAELALKLAYSLMEKHHLTMSSIENYTEKDNIDCLMCEVYIGNDVPLYLMNIITMVNIVCGTFSVIQKIDREKNQKKKLITNFIGDKKDIEFATKLYMFFKKVTHKLANQHRRSIHGNFTNWRSFCEGFSSRLVEKANEQQNSSISESNKKIEELGSEYVLSKEQSIQVYEYRKTIKEKIQKFISENKFKQEKPKNQTKVDMNSYRIGRVTAENYNPSIINDSV